MAKKMITAETAIKLGREISIAGIMGQSSNSLVLLDTENLNAYPASDQFHAVIEEVGPNDIEYADFHDVHTPVLNGDIA